MKTITSRIESHIVLGAAVYWVPDGTQFGSEPQSTSGIKSKPAWQDVVGTEEQSGIGKFLGMVDSWKFNPTYTEMEVKGVHPNLHRHVKKTYRNIEQVAPTFTTQNINPEAFTLLFGLPDLPAQGQSAQPFSNSSGSLSGWIYVQVLDSFRATGTDDEVAQVILHGDLRLTDSDELTSEFAKASFELMVDEYPKDGFTNVAINASLPNT